ncbi:hypothetical protein MAPG_05490 [Magnaporthiopsis poae ATCC 64411]|uniref:GTP-binding protein EsdC n=1 Tax=Magnaporthiopsis poae (strain ATCC 64411 / 73-15) TaxID=644358 RepID=A0A0C4DZI8_MAGP6|nr:hypothetical protein MAPG_05490 [Magnaporthiopsis poae ATCC 64411]
MSSQLTFSLRVSSGVKSVHLLGSWDNYHDQLPLSKDKTASKSGTWKGTFRFPGGTLEGGQRYWYYYIIDGYHCAHNPAEASTVEPTTGRSLNILDVAKSSSSSSKSSSRHSTKSSRSSKSSSSSSSSSKRSSTDIAKGRPLSISQIKSPKPVAPHATRHILDGSYDDDEVAELAHRLGSARFEGEYEYDGDVITDFGSQSASPVSSLGSGSDLSYRSDSSSPNSSMSGYSTPASECSSCTCERYGITRKGDRVRLDCGGSRCGYDGESSDCSSSEDEYVSSRSSRRHGMVVRS